MIARLRLFLLRSNPTYLWAFQWYRRLYGGRWERHYIDLCMADIWMPMAANKKWPEYVQPCSLGPPVIEDWPERAP